MGVTNFPNGVGSFGLPVFPGASRPYTGKAYFVNGNTNFNGSNGNSGLKPTEPFATLAYAVTQVTANNDDVIYVLAGHTEAISSAAIVACATAGFSIVGLGNGRSRPVFTWSGVVGATWTVAGANVTIDNCVFIGTGLDAITTMFAITGDDCTFQNCEFDIGITSFVPLLGITITGTDRFRFLNNHVHGAAVANCTNFIQIVGSSGKQKDYVFAGNVVKGNFTTTLGVINNITTAMVNIVVRDNTFVNGTTSSTKCIVLLTGSTGMVMKNVFGVKSGAAPITGDQVHWGGNWSTAAVATDGTLV